MSTDDEVLDALHENLEHAEHSADYEERLVASPEMQPWYSLPG
jgi:hypothetical protein